MARILVVEDHATMRAALRAVLEPAGHQVAEAGDGSGALRSIRESPPDLVVLDLNIPGISGDELLAELKGSPATRDVTVVVVTAAGEEGRAAAVAAGADAYFTKPFAPRALLRTVSQALGDDAPAGA